MKTSLLSGLILVLLAGGCARHTSPEPVPARTADRSYPYRKPLTSLGAKFGALPTAVQNTVRAEAGMTEITEVFKAATAERVYYKISFKDVLNYPPLYIASDGSVLNPDLTVAVPAPHDASGGLAGGPAKVVTASELPANVLAVIHERASGAEIATISKEIWGDHVVYLVSFTDEENHPKLAVSAEGTAIHPAR
ncbi:MAG TPA: hypothetical protein VNZ64_06520 [Candidatus Acidoferrum sp.]|jgi:hypothetical protein|nr:hypothetical protein [Candidatus Acidoferrum sp.]